MTAIGNPSGIATTITVTAIMKALTITSTVWEVKIEIPEVKLIIVSLRNKTQPIKIAIKYPKSPIRFDNSFNCFLSGVKLASSPSSSSSSLFPPLELSKALLAPSKVLSPTAATIIFPYPSTTWDPENTKGQVYFCPFCSNPLTFHIISDSPVTGDSSIPALASPKTNPSTLIISPILSFNTSPTRTSSIDISFSLPSRITSTFLSLVSLLNFKNCSVSW